MLIVRGKYEREEETSRLVVAEITPIDVVRDRAVREVEIRLAGPSLARQAMHALAGVLDKHAGDRRVRFVVEMNGAVGLRVRVATARRVRPSDSFVRDVEGVCGSGAVVFRQ